MTDLLRILFLVPIGFVAAILATALTIIAGWYGHDVSAILTDAASTGYVIGMGFWVILEVGVLAVIPAFIFIVLAELFGWRSVFLYIAAGGAFGLVASTARGVVWDMPEDRLLLLAAGFVGGLVYWLIAGRLSGIGRAGEAQPAPLSSEPPGRPPTSPE